jgi:hypothetical protein
MTSPPQPRPTSCWWLIAEKRRLQPTGIGLKPEPRGVLADTIVQQNAALHD